MGDLKIMQQNEQNPYSQTWDISTKYVFPTLMSLGRLTGSTGTAIFSTSKFVRFVTGVDNSPYDTPAIVIAASSSIFMNLAIRTPAMFLHFQDINYTPQIVENPVPLKFQYKGLSLFLQSIMILSTVFSSLGSYLGAIGIIEKFTNKNDNEIYNIDKIMAALAITSALYVVVCNVFSNVTLPLKSARKNIHGFSLDLQERTFPFNKYTLFTLAISLPGVICQPFQGFFSTSNAIKKIPYIDVPDRIAHGIGALSSCTLTTYQIFTQIPAVNRKLKNKNLIMLPVNKHYLDTPFTIAVHAVGIVDSIVNGANIFYAITSTAHDAFDVDQKDKYLISFAIVAGLSFAIMQYIFGVLENFAEVKKDFYNLKQTNMYTLVPSDDEDDLEAGNRVIPKVDDQAFTISTSQHSIFAQPEYTQPVVEIAATNSPAPSTNSDRTT